MVQVARNRSRVRCVPLGIPREGPAEGWRTYAVRIEGTSVEPGWEDLLAASTGREVEAIVPPEALAALAGAPRWDVTAERVGPRTMRIRRALTDPPRGPCDPGDEEA